MAESKNIGLKDILFVIALFITPILQMSLNWRREKALSVNILGCNFIFTEIFYFVIILSSILFLYRLKFNKLNFLILGGILISLLSCYSNNYNNWYSRFLVGMDFYICGLLFSLIRFKEKYVRIIKPILLLTFFFVAFQQILVSLGFVHVDSGNVESTGAAGESIIRYGTTIGSVNQTGYLLLILMGIFVKILNNKYLILGVIVIGSLSILLTLSRGPILSLAIVIVSYLFINFKNKKTKIGILLLCVFIILLENQFGVLTSIMERNNTPDITSGRDYRWERTLKIYENSSFFLGAGNAITPSEKQLMSEIPVEKEISSSPHNIYLSYLVENGIFGLIIFLSLIIYLLFSLYKKKPKIDFSLLIFTILPITLMNTEIILRNSIVAFFFWFLYTILINQETIKKQDIAV